MMGLRKFLKSPKAFKYIGSTNKDWKKQAEAILCDTWYRDLGFFVINFNGIVQGNFGNNIEVL